MEFQMTKDAIETFVPKIEAEISILKDGTAMVKEEMAVMKEELVVIKGEVSVLQRDMCQLQVEWAILKAMMYLVAIKTKEFETKSDTTEYSSYNIGKNESVLLESLKNLIKTRSQQRKRIKMMAVTRIPSALANFTKICRQILFMDVVFHGTENLITK
jgi:iron uptake system EfeUOB component EfeO/EfeM